MNLIINIPDNYDLSKIQNGSIASKILLNAVANGTSLEKHDEEIIKETVASIWGKPCADAVSRKEVDELSKELVHTTRDKADFLCNFWERLQKLSPVNPQNDVLDKIRAEIEECKRYRGLTGNIVIDKHNVGLDKYYDLGLEKAIKIIDKYRKESEE